MKQIFDKVKNKLERNTVKFLFSDFVSQGFEQPGYATPKPAPYGFNPQQQTPYPNAAPSAGPQMPPMGNVFGQPIVQDMAFQYGQQVLLDCLTTTF